jgi:hypothetical protein
MSAQSKPGPTPVQEIPKTTKQEPGKPCKVLPTARISSSKQLDILRAYAAVSRGGKPANVNEVAGVMKLAPSTVMMANPFFCSVGLLQKTDASAYMPSNEVMNFLHAFEWNSETAAHKLSQLFRDSWFGQLLIPRLKFSEQTEEEALALLSEASAAGKERRKELSTLVDFLELTGVVAREGGQLTIVRTTPGESVKTVPESVHPGSVATTFNQYPAGGVHFDVNVHVDMAEFSAWEPTRIAAFFRGIAEVLAAKANIEKTGSQPS